MKMTADHTTPNGTGSQNAGHTQNKYQRLLKCSMEDLRDDCARVVHAEGTASLETLQTLISSIEQVKAARMAYQVWEDATSTRESK